MKKLITVSLFLAFLLLLFFVNPNSVEASYYNGRENYLGYGIDVARASSISQDAVKTTSGILDSTFLNSRVHYQLPARSTNYDTSSGYSSEDFFTDFSAKVDIYQGVSGRKGAFAYGEAYSFNLTASTGYENFNSVYFNRTSVYEVVDGYGLDECTSNTSLYSSNVRSAFLSSFNSLPSYYNSTTYNQFVSFFQTYGTHIICKAYYGGRVDVYKTVTTNEMNFDLSTQNELSNYFEGEYKNIVSGSSTQTYSLSSELGWSTSDYSEQTHIAARGGTSFYITNDVNDLNNSINSWKSTVTYLNSDLIDFGDNSLLPIYELVRPLNNIKAIAMQYAYYAYLSSNYDTALEQAKTGTPFKSNEVKVYSSSSGRLITDDGRWYSPHENVYLIDDLNIDIDSLRELGYTIFDLTIKLKMKEIDPGYQHIHIYDRYNEDGTALLIDQYEDYEYGGGGSASTNIGWSMAFEFQDIPISKLTNNYFTIRARGSGLGEDDWRYYEIVVLIEFKK